jgi:iron complex outermembrane receptor protein
MRVNYFRLGLGLLCATTFSVPGVLQAAERQIEEIVVTGERRESTVQDTSISITAFTSEMLDDFGIRNQSDLQNMIPATTIQPYDAAVRGVGRNFRNLGGDPGVATYMNGVYSEDLYTATIGSFWDIDRIEILRGPQGTLYGRNAVGGAMNFLYKKPTDEFEFSAKAVLGTYRTHDTYLAASGPLKEGVLNGRLTASSRQHDGWIEERSDLGPDLDSGDEMNFAVQLEWFINDDMTFHVRSNKAKIDRTFGGGDGGGLIVLSGENNIIPGGDQLRNYTVESNGIRDIDYAVIDPTDSAFFDATQPVFTFTNPTTGAAIPAQRIRPGVDGAGSSGHPNYGRDVTADPSDCVFLDRKDIDGDDLCAYTNGLNVEIFDQQGNQAEFTWDINEALTFKYIFGYSELMYERITEDDSTASLTDDEQFYVNHEAEYVSHEFQLFSDVTDSLTFTSGVFFYNAYIDQRYDFYSSVSSPQFVDPNWAMDTIVATLTTAVLGLPSGSLVPGDPALTFLAGATPAHVFSAKESAQAAGYPEGQIFQATGSWLGDDSLGSIPHGIVTPGSNLHGVNRTEREAFAAYTQGVWDINEKFTLTAGLRYAWDDISGEENYVQYAETMSILDAFGLNLATANIFRGAIDGATLQPTGLVEPWLAGVPITFGLHRHFQKKKKKITWRINLDYTIDDASMMYANVTSGYRSGGFNLTFFSQTPEFDPEELIAYELGYKGQFLDNSLQVNASLYYYDYDTIHTRTEEACPPGGTPLSAQSACAVADSTTSVQSAPGAEINGLEFEVLWLATDNWTFGGNFSYTDTEYTKSFMIVDGASPTTPGQIYDADSNPDRRIDVKGNQLLQVPETKASAYAVYNYPLGSRGDLDLLASWSYIDDVYFSAYASKADLAPAYDRFDLRATWTNADESWIVSAFVNNVQNEIGIRQILKHGGGDGFRRTAQVSEPRHWGFEFTYTMR